MVQEWKLTIIILKKWKSERKKWVKMKKKTIKKILRRLGKS